MNCCQCQGIEDLFNEKNVSRELAQYRKNGPGKTTRVLVNAIKTQGIEESTLLDIGGGVGAIQHELLNGGASEAVDVDASQSLISFSACKRTPTGHLPIRVKWSMRLYPNTAFARCFTRKH